MISYKITGAIEITKGDNSARVRVLSFKKNGVYNTDQNEIKKTFLPEGYVFAAGIRDDFEMNSLVEFLTKENNNWQNSTDDQFIRDRSHHISYAGYEVLTMPDQLIINDSTIDFEELEKQEIYIDEFYIRIRNEIYGPFKKTDDHLHPLKEVYKIIPKSNDLYVTGDRHFLLKKEISDVKFDCMNRAQLGEWLTEQLRKQNITVDLSTLKKALLNQETSALDKSRMMRALSLIDQLELSLSDLKILAGLNENLDSVYSAALQSARVEIIEPLLAESANTQKGIEDLQLSLNIVEDELAEKTLLLNSTCDQLEMIKKEKNRHIEDIRVHSMVFNNSAEETHNLIKYDEQIYVKIGSTYQSIQDFIQNVNQSLAGDNDQQGKLIYKSVIQLKEFKCVLAGHVEPILQIAKLSNNCKVIIQQVEPDWLKFDFLLVNGLKHIWESANKSPDIIHFLILQDLNMSSLECYGRPLNDFIDKIRQSLPGLTGNFPNNLWIFGIPLKVYTESQFGLPLIEETYKNWGAFPISDTDWQFNTNTSDKSLTLKDLIGHDMIATISKDTYFQAR